MAFLNNSILEDHPTDPYKWVLHEDLVFSFSDIKFIKTDEIIVIPKGFVTDLASVPRFAWNIVPPFGRYKKEAILHDYLYATAMFSKKVTDKLFLVTMKQAEVKMWKRRGMYWSVKYGGANAWETHRVRAKKASVKQIPYPELLPVGV